MGEREFFLWTVSHYVWRDSFLTENSFPMENDSETKAVNASPHTLTDFFFCQ